MKQRIEYIDLAKGICIALVVFRHASYGAPDYTLGNAMTAFRMPLYFFLSGLFFKTYEGWMSFSLRKVNIVPFLFFHIISFFIFTFLLRQSFKWELLWCFTIHPYHAYNIPLWFLLCLFWLNQLFYGLYKISFATRYPLAVLITGTVLLGVLGYSIGGTQYDFRVMNLSTALTAMPFFSAGYIFNRHTSILQPARWDRWLLPMAIVLATYTYVFNIGTANFVNNTYDSGIFRMYSCGLAGVLAVMFISKRLTKIPLISYFGRYSIMILVTHGIVIRLIQPQLFKFHISEWWINALICTSLTLLVY